VKLSQEHADDAALLGIAEHIHELTDFEEWRCRRIAARIIALGDLEYGEEDR
jgi:signal recognition particle GTPase